MKGTSPKVTKTFLESSEEDICNVSQKKKEIKKEKIDHSNMSLQELISALKDKISIYESEIQSLIDEKLRMQIEINNLQLINKRNKDPNNNVLVAETQITENPLIELNKQMTNESTGLKKELNVLSQSISKQKELINSPKFVSSFKNDKCPGCEAKTEQLNKLSEEKVEICAAIQDLKTQLEEMKKAQSENEKKEKEKKAKNKKNKSKINTNESLPNIEQYFILNNKFQLVDSNRNLWHMKKCQKFEQFKEEKKKEYSTEDEILMAFVNQYDNKSDDDPSRQEEIKKAIAHPANSTTDHPNLPNNDQSYHSN